MKSSYGSAAKFALIPAVIVLFLAIYPQINIWSVKGGDWHGAYVVSNYDEVAYSAYVNSLIEGKSRRNDPFIGQDDLPYESLYSIQVIPAYSIAIPARFFGFSASTAFILLNFLIPIFACLAIFLLIRDVTKDDLLASVGVLTVLCLGAAIAFQGELQHMILGNYLCDFFPFLRRYQPGFAFPLFFLFCLFLWRAFTAEKNKMAMIYTIISGLTLVVLVFSYFFLWTAALAWFACLTILWLAARKEDRSTTIIKAGIIVLFGISAIIPYFLLLSNRTPNTDSIQLLNYTRIPNLFEVPEIIGFLIAGGIFYLIRHGKLKLDSPDVLFTLSITLTPILLFNQQVVTGRSLQPVHYEVFVANYLLLTALVFFVSLIRRSFPGESFASKYRKALIYAGVAVVVWGFIESSATAKRNAGFENLRDAAVPALGYLREEGLQKPKKTTAPTVMSNDLMVADYIPTVTSYRPLWNPHTNSAGGVNHDENLELFYKYLYYSGYDEKDLTKAINENLFEVMAALFGGGRALPSLSRDSQPVTKGEVEKEIGKYRNFRNNFNEANASDPLISYIIVPTKAEPNFSNLDRWYQRDEGKTFGLFKVYGLRPRFASQPPDPGAGGQ